VTRHPPIFFTLSRLLSLSLLLGVALPVARPADVERPVPLAPLIPENDFSAAKLGVEADQPRPVTAELQHAIDAVARAGGGRLVLAAGDYLSGPLRLVSNLDLHLTKGVRLRLLPREDDYPVEGNRYLSLLSGSGLHDVRLSGEGVIDGQGAPWWRAFRAKELSIRRPQLVVLDRCDRVEFTGVTFLNPPNTHVSLRLCREVRMADLVLEAPGDSPNTDGLNISGKNYLITGCRISTGDDNIVILTSSAPADRPAPVCESFTVRDCKFGAGHGMSIGSYISGGIRDLLVERCTFDGTTGGIRMKADRDRGGLVENLVYRDIVMHGVRFPVYITSYYPKTPAVPELDAGFRVNARTPRWQNILIENLDATGSLNSLILWGLPELPLGAITLRHVRIASELGGRLYHAGEVTFEDVSLETKAKPVLERWPVAVPTPTPASASTFAQSLTPPPASTSTPTSTPPAP
jgi:polygalacturonase